MPHVTVTYPFEKVVLAEQELEEGHMRGKMVLQVACASGSGLLGCRSQAFGSGRSQSRRRAGFGGENQTGTIRLIFTTSGRPGREWYSPRRCRPRSDSARRCR
jgi:hypothetical protein